LSGTSEKAVEFRESGSDQKTKGATLKVRTLRLLSAFLFSLSAMAQNANRVELFGGYSYTRYSVYDLDSNSWNRFGYNGWEAAASAKLTSILAAEADFSGGSSSPYGQSSTLHTYMVGPRVFGNFGRATIYGHVLFGGLAFNIAGLSSTSFAADFGAGADLWLKRHFGARLIQADYIESDNTAAARGVSSTYSRNQGRISTGLVFRFGH
jgi:hypothetical protein